MAENSAKRWRAPAPEERQRDAERTRAALLEAALEEFAAKGQAGARVQDIADRAGVNKHLISYYFGGKEGLYRELQRRWVEHEREFAGEDVPLDEVAVRYLRRCVDDPRPTRLMLWNGLEDGPKPEDTPVAQSIRDDLDQIKKRQERGELPAELDPASVRLAVNAMTAAPMLMPHVVRVAFGLDPGSPEFEKRYGEQLRLMIKLLCGGGAPDADG
ncbi:TetR/AcrR family transcriptional regulator [Spirillospora sp. CA-128828]|uniref:TetR/AcrR family transcriptional regulator n=1 Tax=Spirillospora sp. CA-128828 TaxID=3240033 RepID=UPI003D8E505F